MQRSEAGGTKISIRLERDPDTALVRRISIAERSSSCCNVEYDGTFRYFALADYAHNPLE